MLTTPRDPEGGSQPQTRVSPDADLSTFTPWTQVAQRLGFISPQICRRPLDCLRPCACRRRERQPMTDRTLNISAALREAQLQQLEASLASKSASKPQAMTEAAKDKDAKRRD